MVLKLLGLKQRLVQITVLLLGNNKLIQYSQGGGKVLLQLLQLHFQTPAKQTKLGLYKQNKG